MELLRNDYANVVELKEQHYFSLATTPCKGQWEVGSWISQSQGGACINQGLGGSIL